MYNSFLRSRSRQENVESWWTAFGRKPAILKSNMVFEWKRQVLGECKTWTIVYGTEDPHRNLNEPHSKRLEEIP